MPDEASFFDAMSGVKKLTNFMHANESGNGYAVTSYISDLSKYGVNNDISSACSTGM